MKKLLLLSYFFPPSSEVAAKPTARLVRHLPKYGWEAVVVAPSIDGYLHLDSIAYADVTRTARLERTPVWVHPMELLARVHLLRRALRGQPADRMSLARAAHVPLTGSGGSILRRVRYRMQECLRFPDDSTGWILPAYRRASQLLRRERFDAMLSVSPAASAHLAARLVHRRFPDLPWFAQFHDPWSSNPFHDWWRPLARMLTSLEASIIRNSSQAAFATEEALEHYVTLYGDRSRFFVLPNGFDPLDFPAMPPEARTDLRFTFTYTGSLYGERSPAGFLHALASLIRRAELRENAVRVRLIGECDFAAGKSMRDLTRALGLAAVVEISPPLSYPDSLAALASSDVLLLFAQGQPLQIPAKAFEYLALEKPILAFATGASARLVEATSSGIVVTSDDPQEAEPAIRSLITGSDRSGRKSQVSEDSISAYRADVLAGLLAERLTEATKPNARSAEGQPAPG